MRTWRASIPCCACVFLLASSVFANPVSYSATFNTTTYSFYAEDPQFCGIFCSAYSSVQFGSSSGFPTFSADFLSESQLLVTYSAPVGYRFEFNPPVGADSVTFNLWFGDGLSLVYLNANSAPGVSLTSSGADGTAPLDSNFEMAFGNTSAWPSPPPYDFAAFYSGSLSGPFAFESVSALFDVPSAYDRTFVDLSPSVSLSGYASWGYLYLDPAPSDPGVWGTIAPVPAVPEPASLLLLGTGLVGLVRCLKRRHSGDAERGKRG